MAIYFENNSMGDTKGNSFRSERRKREREWDYKYFNYQTIL